VVEVSYYMPRPRPVLLRNTLGAQYPNLMLRCMRAVRLLRIDMTMLRLMYLRMFVALKVLEGRSKREDVQRVVHTLTTDAFVCERDTVDISDCLRDALQEIVTTISCKLSVAETRMRAAMSN
jgi:hypothetical protein